ncbi:hypothetical protein [Limobrevibacterium gyesilva]|uniref:Uncharacterized protein n=1 Tax=Limobrevibacterium gyesilva TaxID=2991712 RepID=A0AA42CJV2_9PROT|nr:hypothetical protein [Limobrevibacterium gyesilva]MCW3477272.1 hypothetical protein [Limobrevibacterium gyesilva]
MRVIVFARWLAIAAFLCAAMAPAVHAAGGGDMGGHDSGGMGGSDSAGHDGGNASGSDATKHR